MNTKLSRKYTFAFLAMLAVIACVWLGVKNDKDHQWIIISGIAGITIICVSYLTGQAKIDLKAAWGNNNGETKVP